MSTRRQTRAKNSDQHPGAVVGRLRTRRTKEEISREKEEKEKRKAEQAARREKALKEKEEKEEQKEERAALRRAAVQQATVAKERKKFVAEQKRIAKEQEAADRVRKQVTAAESRETAMLETVELENNLLKAHKICDQMGSTVPNLAGKRGRRKLKDVTRSKSSSATVNAKF